MLHLQDPFSRLHSHHKAHFGNPQQEPQTSQSELAARRLEEAKQRAIAAIRRPHQPTKLCQVQGADDDGTDEAPTSPRSPCPPPRIKQGEGTSLFERTSFRKPAERDGRREGSLEDRVSFAPPTGPSAERGRARGREGGQDNRSAAREPSPFTFAKEDAQINKVETAWNPGQWAAAPNSSTALYNDAATVAAQAAEIVSPVPSPWGKNMASEEEYVPPPATTPPPMAAWSTQNHKEQQPATNGFGHTARPLPLNLGNTTLQTPNDQTTFHPLATAVWKTPQGASFIKPIRAPIPVTTALLTCQAPTIQAAAPRSVPTHYATTSQTRTLYNQPSYTPQPHTMPQLQYAHIAPSAALSLNPPLTPPLSTSSSHPQLSTSVYLACLGAQTGGGTRVMLKCRMDICANREGVSFGKESLRNGVVERYRQGFGCGGCGEMLDVVVC